MLIAVSLMTVIALALAACGGATPTLVPTEPRATEAPTVVPTEAAMEVPTEVPTEAPTSEPVTVKIGVLPIIDALPMFVAQNAGYYEANGVTVEFVPVGSAAERDQLFQAGEIDGMINDMISTVLYNKESVQVVTVGFARTATTTYPQYRILASAQSGFTSADQLKGVEIGISEGTVIAYTTDRLLQAEGLAPEDIKTIAVPKISDRLALLGSGEIKAANLPDPLASLAIANGAVVITDDTKHPEYGYSLYSFSAEFVADHPEAVKGFLAATYTAAADINADKTKWDQLMADQKLLPQPLQGKYTLSDFPVTGAPTEDQFNDVVSWAKDKGILTADVLYADSVTATFLP